MARWIGKIKNSLSPDLLKTEYRVANENNPMFGHCYVATETLYHLMDSDDVKPCCGRDDDGIVHWWLEYRKSGKRIDVTAEQYLSVGKVPPYENGRGSGFLTKEPSKRARLVMDKVMKIVSDNDNRKVV